MADCTPDQGFDYIFGRMSAIYGNDFARKWDGIDPNLIRQEWIGTLGHYLTIKSVMDYALSNLDPVRPPSSIQMKKLCYDAPRLNTADKVLEDRSKSSNYSEDAKRAGLAKLEELRKSFGRFP
jgi:hypothetical protein